MEGTSGIDYKQAQGTSSGDGTILNQDCGKLAYT